MKTTKQQKTTSNPLLNSTRPKQVNVTMTRTAKGYIVRKASLLKKLNQHATTEVTVDATTLVADLNKRGVVIL